MKIVLNSLHLDVVLSSLIKVQIDSFVMLNG